MRRFIGAALAVIMLFGASIPAFASGVAPVIAYSRDWTDAQVTVTNVSSRETMTAEEVSDWIGFDLSFAYFFELETVEVFYTEAPVRVAPTGNISAIEFLWDVAAPHDAVINNHTAIPMGVNTAGSESEEAFRIGGHYYITQPGTYLVNISAWRILSVGDEDFADFDGEASFYVVVEGEAAYPEPEPGTVPDPDAGPLDGAAAWALPELELALEAGLIFEEFIGLWGSPTNRELAAEAIVWLVESLTGQTIEEIAEENEFDMSVPFIDTDNPAVTFLKAAGISDGIGGNRYDPTGTYNRAQMVTMLGRAAKYLFAVDTASYPKGSDLFTDVPGWADEFVGWAGEAGITQGVGGGRFDSTGVLLNQHTNVFAFRAFAYFAELEDAIDDDEDEGDVNGENGEDVEDEEDEDESGSEPLG